MLSERKSGKFQMAIHIDYDREENKIELILDSQGNVISTLQLDSNLKNVAFLKCLLKMSVSKKSVKDIRHPYRYPG